MQSLYYFLTVVKFLAYFIILGMTVYKVIKQRRMDYVFAGMVFVCLATLAELKVDYNDVNFKHIIMQMMMIVGALMIAYGTIHKVELIKRELPKHVADHCKQAVKIHKDKVVELSNTNVYLKDELRKRKEAEEELHMAKKAAESANESKTDFLSNITHELRTPMHGILSYAHFGIQKIEKVPKEKLLFYFEQINDSGKRLMQLINNLLDLSRMQAGRLNFSMEHFELEEVLRGVISELKVLAKNKRVVLKLKQTKTPTTCICDGHKIRQVFTNLASNAIKYSKENTVVTMWFEDDKVDIGGDMVEPGLRFCILDEGVGIPKDELLSVFDKFVQSSKTKTGAGGSGVGLAICKQIVEGHRGGIWSESGPNNVGSLFSFVIPRQQKRGSRKPQTRKSLPVT